MTLLMLSAVTVDREWDVPLFRQVADILRRRIESGELRPRRPVPSLKTLTEEYGVSRITASKAVAILADEGLIHVVRGKGWYVTDRNAGE